MSNVLLVRIFAFACLCTIGTASASHSSGEAVVTDKGVVVGTKTSSARQFLGIPYAAAPVGERRWKEPQPVARWHTPRLTQQFSSSCPQTPSPFGLASVDEDCLYLNVYTPRHVRRGDRHPVMVWFHPGAFQFGEADDYDPSELVARGVVVVTVNYRLGALGFLAHPALTAESRNATSGNYALMDQQQALEWVRKNIDAFGGDARAVTIFGESAGGLSVHAHLASPRSRHLFDRAIVQSGAYSLEQSTLATAEEQGRAFAERTGCTAQDSACLRSLPVDVVLAKQVPDVLGFLPNVDGYVLKRSVGEAFATGKFNKVPVMQGATHDEYRLFVPLFFDFVSGPATPELYPIGISIILGVPPAEVPAIMNAYPLENYANTDTALATLATDAVFACSMKQATDDLARHVPTWIYEFSDATAPQRYLPPASIPYAAAHESELQYLFDIMTNMPPVPLNETQEQLSQAMITAWSNFAHTGNPNFGSRGLALPIWFRAQTGYVHSWQSTRGQPYSRDAYATDHKCDFWETH